MQHKDYSTVVTLFVARCMTLKQARLSPLVVFDSIGCVSTDKAPERERRAKRRAAGNAELLLLGDENLDDDERADREAHRLKYLRMALSITPELVFATTRGLRAAGIQHVVSPGEADHQLVRLVQSELATWACSIDGDILAHGVPVIRMLKFDTGRGVAHHLKEGHGWWKGLTSSVAHAFLCGCDYSPGIPGIGKLRAKAIMEGGQSM